MSPPTFIVPSLWQHQGSPEDPECMEVDDSDQIGCPVDPHQKPYDPRSGPRINNDPKIRREKRWRIAYEPYHGTREKRLYHEQKLQSNLFPDAYIFTSKLWELVSNSYIDAITWNHQGDGIIVNQNVIGEEFFSLNGFNAFSPSSFGQQLNLHGFKKLPHYKREPNIHRYFHQNFKRNRPELLPLVRRCNPRSKSSVKFVPENPHMPPPTFIVPSLWQHQGSPEDPECMEVDDSDQIGCPVAPDQIRTDKAYDPRSRRRINNDPEIHLGKRRRIGYEPYHGTREKRLYHEQKLPSDLFLKAYIFASKLWQLVNNGYIDAINWNHQGDGIIVNQNLIGEEFFSLNGFNAFSPSSFGQQLNLHGFKKLPHYKREPNIHRYFHRNFKRNRPELLPLVRRCSQRSE